MPRALTAQAVACAPAHAVEVLVVDGDGIARAGWSALLSAQDWIDGCLTTASVDQALEIIRRQRVDVAVIDLFLADAHGMDVCRRLLEEPTAPRALLVAERDGRPIGAARAAGASGLVYRGSSVDEMLGAVARIAAGGQAFQGHATTVGSDCRLSRRERTVLRMLAGGASNVEIAARLHLSPHTIKEYTQTVFRKLGVRNRVEAATTAARLGYAE